MVIYMCELFFQMIYSGKRSLAAVLIVIVGIIAAFMPTLFTLGTQIPCVLNKKISFSYIYVLHVHSLLLIILVTAIPDIVFFFGNIAILWRVRKYRSEVIARGNQTREERLQGRVTRTAITLSLTHLILTLPGIMYVKITKSQVKSDSIDILGFIFTVMTLANYGINIIIYLTTSEIFVKELYSVFSCKHFTIGMETVSQTNNTNISQVSNTRV